MAINITPITYPNKLIANKNDYSITLTRDGDNFDLTDFTYKLYLLDNRSVVSATSEYVDPLTSVVYTRLTSTDVTNKFRVGENIYILDESTNQVTRSGIYTIIQQLDDDNIVIDKSYVIDVTLSLTVNSVIGYDRLGSFKDGTATFFLYKDVYDLNINEFTNLSYDSPLFKQLYTASTYSSEQLEGSLTFDNIFYDVTTSGNDNPILQKTMTVEEFNDLTYSIGDTISVKMSRETFDYPEPGLWYDTQIINDVEYHYLTVSNSVSFDTVNLLYPGENVYISGSTTSINPLRDIMNKNFGVTSVNGTEFVTGQLLTTAHKTYMDTVGSGDGYLTMQVRVNYDGLSRNGSFIINDVDYSDGKLKLKIGAKGLGKPSSETVYNNGGTYTPSHSIETSVINAGSQFTNTVNVAKFDEFGYINARLDYLDYNDKDNFNDKVIYKVPYVSDVEDKVLSKTLGVSIWNPSFISGKFPIPNGTWKWNPIGFNDLRFINYVDAVDVDYGGNVATTLLLNLYYPASNGGYIKREFFKTLDSVNKMRMLTFGASPSQLLTLGFTEVGESSMVLSDWDDAYGYGLQLGSRSVTDDKVLAIATALTMFSVDDECVIYNKMRLLYRDELGSFNGLNFTLGNTKTVNAADTSYTADNLSFDDSYNMTYDNIRGGKRTTNRRETTNYQLISDWVKNEEVPFFEDAFRSTEHFLQVGENTDLTKLVGVHLVDTTFTEMDNTRNTLFQYIINVEVNNKINIK